MTCFGAMLKSLLLVVQGHNLRLLTSMAEMLRTGFKFY